MNWLALLLLASVPHSPDRVTDTVYDRCDLVELNTYGGEQCCCGIPPEHAGHQVVFWDESPYGWQVAAWTFVPPGFRWTA